MTEKLTLAQQNALHQRTFKAKQKAENPEEYRKQKTEEMRIYRQKRKEREASIAPKTIKAPEPPKEVQLKPVKDLLPPKKKRGEKKSKKIEEGVVPLYKKTNKHLSQSSIEDYISKLNTIHKLMTDKTLDSGSKGQLIKLLEHKEFYKSLIEVHLKYLKNINEVITKLRAQYQNDNTFRNYINVLAVVLGRLPTHKAEYQQTAQLNIELTKAYNEERNKNELKPEDEDKLIPSFDSKDIEENMQKLPNLYEKVVYSLNMYLTRRLEIRSLVLATKEENKEDNFLIVDKQNEPIKAIFNDYKTKGSRGSEEEVIPEQIKELIKDYLTTSKIKMGHYVLGQNKDRRMLVSEGNFSLKVKTIFKKIYGADISNRWVRISQASNDVSKEDIEMLKKINEKAKKLSHSAKVHLQYVKFKKS